MADAELNSILAEVKNGIQQVLHDYIPVFKDTVAASTGELVYAKYTSPAEVPYMQRESAGGLADPNNYEVQEGDLQLTIFNNTTGNAAYSGSDGWDSGYINDIIESGSGYHWRNSEMYRHPVARPFMEKAGDTFVDDILIPLIDMKMKQILGG